MGKWRQEERGLGGLHLNQFPRTARTKVIWREMVSTYHINVRLSSARHAGRRANETHEAKRKTEMFLISVKACFIHTLYLTI